MKEHRSTEDYKKKRAERLRLRYESDPAYRQRMKDRHKAWEQKRLETDPGFKKRRQQYYHEYMREYHQRPEVIKRITAIRADPSHKAKMAEYMKAYRKRPDVAAKRKAYYSSEEHKAKMKIFRERYKAKREASTKSQKSVRK